MQLYPNSLWIGVFIKPEFVCVYLRSFWCTFFPPTPSLCVYLRFSINVTEQQNILSFNFKSLSKKIPIIIEGYTRLRRAALTVNSSIRALILISVLVRF